MIETDQTGARTNSHLAKTHQLPPDLSDKQERIPRPDQSRPKRVARPPRRDKDETNPLKIIWQFMIKFRLHFSFDCFWISYTRLPIKKSASDARGANKLGWSLNKTNATLCNMTGIQMKVVSSKQPQSIKKMQTDLFTCPIKEDSYPNTSRLYNWHLQ